MHLNVRDRRVVARIAYVGASGAGRTTNLTRLGAKAGEGALAVEWRPPSGSRFRDCDVVVELMANPGTDELASSLHDVDGVVFVADAAADAQERNQRALAATRAAMARRTDDVALVVQVNKRDLPNALPTAAVLSALAAEEAPHVEAVALRGEGVAETAERALDEVLRIAARTPAHEPEHDASPARPALRGESNPLLSSLRQILRDTVAEHVTELRARERDPALDDLVAEVRALRAAVERAHAAPKVEAPSDAPTARDALARLEAIHAVVLDLGEDMKRRKWGWFR
jgi:hypothetical protein